jgi:subtilisin-like proprotein convertase family protein
MLFFRSSGPAGVCSSKCVGNSIRKTLIGLATASFCIIFASHGSASTYTGTNTGAIPDGGSPTPTCGVPRDVQFSVAGFPGNVGSTSVSFTMTPQHGWIGDLQVSLIAPNGTSHLLFSRIGANTATDVGDNANLDGTYVFNDLAAGNIWTSAASSPGLGFDIPPGSYRTQAAGPFVNDSPGPALTSMNGTFVAVPPASVNGNWILRFQDCSTGNTGTVSAASLTLIPFAAASASISGRVTTSYGAGIRSVLVTAYGGALEQPKVAYTGTFGYYQFDGLTAGESYVVSVAAKRYTFEQPAMLVNLDQSIAGMNFISVQ